MPERIKAILWRVLDALCAELPTWSELPQITTPDAPRSLDELRRRNQP